MDKYSYISNANPEFIDDLYQQYKTNPESVDRQWQTFFEGFEFFDEVIEYLRSENKLEMLKTK